MKWYLLFCLHLPIAVSAQNYLSTNIDVAGYADAGWQIINRNEDFFILTSSFCDLSPYACTGLIKVGQDFNVVWKQSYMGLTPGAFNSMAVYDSTILFYGYLEQPVDTLGLSVVKTDMNGEIVAQWFYGTSNTDRPFGLAPAADGGFVIVANEETGLNRGKLWLYRCDADGNVLWRKRYGSQFRQVLVYTINQAADGGYVLGCNGCDEPDCNMRVGFVLKIDSLGNEQFALARDSTFGGGGESTYAAPALDGGALMSRYAEINESPWNRPTLYRVDSTGAVEWTYQTDAGDLHYLNNIKLAQDRGFIGVGFNEDHPFIDTTDDQYRLFGGWLFRLDAGGQKQWERIIGDVRYPGDLFGEIMDVVEAADGSLVAVGTIIDTFPNGVPAVYNRDVWLLHLDSAGCVTPGCNGLFQGIVPTREISALPAEYAAVTISPNPASDRTTIRTSNRQPASQAMQMVLFNVLGKECQKWIFHKGQAELEVSLEAIPPGMYYLTVRENFQSYTLPLVVGKK